MSYSIVSCTASRYYQPFRGHRRRGSPPQPFDGGEVLGQTLGGVEARGLGIRVSIEVLNIGEIRARGA